MTRGRSFEEIIPLEQRARLRLLMGHFAYGIHDHIPKPCRYTTILREPVRRVPSVYRYVLSEPANPLHETLTGSSMTLDGYISSGIHRAQTENALTRQLAGEDDGGELTRHDLEIAKGNLRTFLAVDLAAAFDESLILFKRILGWSMPFYFSRNVSAKGPRDVPDKTLELIRERNGFDWQVYGLARSLFQSLVEQQGEGFDREVKLFKLLNRVPRALGSIAEPLASYVRRALERRAIRRSSPV